MPSILEDPTAPPKYRQTGEAPFPTSGAAIPAAIVPIETTPRAGAEPVTIVPFGSVASVPPALAEAVWVQMNREIERGDTYPMLEPFALDAFAAYWFGVFGVVAFSGTREQVAALLQKGQDTPDEQPDWARLVLGSYYIKPNYPGRSSHVCNAGFLVMDAARGRGVGKALAESYLVYAPRLGYRYSVFNLVYANNKASCAIWDGLGFQQIGRVPGAGMLKGSPGQWVDAIIYGKDFTA